MKKMKKILVFALAFMFVFSSVSVGFVSFAGETVTEEAAVVSVIRNGDDESRSVTDVFNALIQRIRKTILILVGNISILFDRSYSDVDAQLYSSDAFSVPGLDDGFVPQGICFVEELGCFALSGYIKGENSRIYLVNEENGDVKEIVLKDFSKHAGGIASDGNNVWVCAGGNENEGGFVYRVSTQKLSAADDGEEIEFDGSFQTQVRASAICCDGEMLYVAEFYEKDDYPVNSSHSFKDNKAWAVGYSLDDGDFSYNGKEMKPDVIVSIPDKVQGMAVSAEGNVIFSTSYGRFYDSTLHIYKPFDEWTQGGVVHDGFSAHLYVADENSLITKVKMPTLMEGIDIEGGSLYAVFESGADAYSDAKEVISSVRRIDLAALFENM